MNYAAGSEKEGGDNENGPKRRVLRRLGHLVSSFIIFHVFF